MKKLETRESRLYQRVPMDSRGSCLLFRVANVGHIYREHQTAMSTHYYYCTSSYRPLDQVADLPGAAVFSYKIKVESYFCI